jgi:hypothetical protein
MKYIISIALILPVFFAKAQSDSTGVYLGINTVQLIRLAGDPSPSTTLNPYLFEAGYNRKNFGFRFGLGMDKHTSTALPSPVNGNVKTQRDSSQTDWRIGAYYSFHVSSRWKLNLGLDYYSAASSMLNAIEFTNENSEQVTNDNLKEYSESGISPYVRIDYKPHPRVAIGTELLFRFGQHTLTETSSSNLLPQFDTEQITEGNRTTLIAPTAIFVCLTL